MITQTYSGMQKKIIKLGKRNKQKKITKRIIQNMFDAKKDKIFWQKEINKKKTKKIEIQFFLDEEAKKNNPTFHSRELKINCPI